MSLAKVDSPEKTQPAAVSFRYATHGVRLSLLVLLASPAIVFMHLVIHDLNAWWWWIPEVPALALSLILIIQVFAYLPSAGRDARREQAIRKVVGGLGWLLAATAVFLVCAWYMPAILYAKSGEGQRAIGIRKEEDRIAAQQQANLARQLEMERRDAELSKQRVRKERERQMKARDSGS